MKPQLADGDNFPEVNIETGEGGSTSSTVNQSQDNSKRINDWGPWVTMVGIIAALSVGCNVGITLYAIGLSNRIDEHKVEERTEENKQTSQMWRIDNHLRDMEITQGVMKKTLEICNVRR